MKDQRKRKDTSIFYTCSYDHTNYICLFTNYICLFTSRQSTRQTHVLKLKKKLFSISLLTQTSILL